MKEKSISIEQHFDCSQREIVIDIARIIYRRQGFDISEMPLMYLYESEHPQEKAILAMAEEIFSLFWGDSPDYDDEE